MLEFKTEKLNSRVTRIFAFATELMYLVEGDERAALLDTGSGIGSLKACVGKLTGKPVIVLLTHGHIDHAMGAGEFEEVYMSHSDDYIYKEHCAMASKRSSLESAPDGGAITEADIIPALPVEKIHDLREGDVFDLGGVSIEIFECPGHTKGSLVMLIREERALLTGDACNYSTFMFGGYSTTITEYEESLKTLQKKLGGKYDTVYISHDDGEGYKEIIGDVIEVCEDIKHGRADDLPFEFHGASALIAKKQEPDQRRKGNIYYSKDKI